MTPSSAPLPFTSRQSLRHAAGVVILLISCLGAMLVTSCATSPVQTSTGPWNMTALSQPPSVSWGAITGLVQEIYYEGEPVDGKPTRVFAYLGRPAGQSKVTLPAMVLVHGGGGKAFKNWTEHWARRGYVALAMDLAGHGPTGRLPDGGPDQSDRVKFRNFTENDTQDMWSYHAVAAVIRGHSLLRSLPEVDSRRVGLTGISWGGYLTCIVAGLDHRFAVAVPVYGCGFLGDNSCWRDTSLASMQPDARALWLKLFDPSEYLGGVRCPILFVNGTTDFAYPLDSYQASYRLVPDKLRHVSVAVNRPHGHIWTFPEVDAFVESVIKQAPPLVRVGPPQIRRDSLTASLKGGTDIKSAFLCFTTNSGPWQKRQWHTTPARVEQNQVRGELPQTRPLVAFISLDDTVGRHMSSEHVELLQDEATDRSTTPSPGRSQPGN